MPRTFGEGGDLDVAGARVGIVVSMFNDQVTRRMLDGALQTAREAGVADDDVQVYWVAGAFELSAIAGRLAVTGHVDAVVALGCIIRGETPHFDFIAAETVRGLMSVVLEHGMPVGMGVITTDNLAQAEARAGGAVGNKGSEAMYAALQTLGIIESIDAEDLVMRPMDEASIGGAG
ncbi:MAG: 6,7-dimethyl-8-ribityllumazine synthase [Dehalococcoidia bacterium]